eukprot:3272315-Amphidinium_carterae.1
MMRVWHADDAVTLDHNEGVALYIHSQLIRAEVLPLVKVTGSFQQWQSIAELALGFVWKRKKH